MCIRDRESPDQVHTVGDIMVSEVTALSQTESVQSAIDKMILGGISHLPVLSERGAVVGLVSEASLLKNDTGAMTSVDEVMRVDFSMVDVDVSIGEARRLLGGEEVLLVSQRGVLVGLVARIDMVRALRDGA